MDRRHVDHAIDPDVVVLAAGDPLPAAVLEAVAREIDAATLTVAADGGLAHAERAGRTVDVLVGDLDSVDAAMLERARAAGTEVVRHPVDKDATDLDLTLGLVTQRWTGTEPPRVLVVGGHGGRTDHLLGNLLLVASGRHAGLRITVWSGSETVTVVRDTALLARSAGAVVSLLAVNGPATGVTTRGLRFPLDGATLEPGSSLGISNELTGADAEVRVRSGVLLAIQSAPADPGAKAHGAELPTLNPRP